MTKLDESLLEQIVEQMEQALADAACQKWELEHGCEPELIAIGPDVVKESREPAFVGVGRKYVDLYNDDQLLFARYEWHLKPLDESRVTKLERGAAASVGFILREVAPGEPGQRTRVSIT